VLKGLVTHKVVRTLTGFLLLVLLFPKRAYALYWLGEGCSVSRTICLARDRAGQCTQPQVVEVATIKGVECAFSNTISVVLALAGIVLFVMFLIGGLRYLTSGGDPKATEAAKGTLTHAIAGLVVLILAFLILRLIETITGVQLTIFKVTQ